MDKALKRKIRKLWRDRLLMSVGVVAFLGLSVLQLQAVLRHRPQQLEWALDLAQHVEVVANEKNSDEEQTFAILEIQEIARENQMILTELWAKALITTPEIHIISTTDTSRRVLEDRNDRVWDVYFSHDGAIIATNNNDGIFRLHHRDGSLISSLEDRWFIRRSDGRSHIGITINNGRVWLSKGYSDGVWNVHLVDGYITITTVSSDGAVNLWSPSGIASELIEAEEQHRDVGWSHEQILTLARVLSRIQTQTLAEAEELERFQVSLLVSIAMTELKHAYGLKLQQGRVLDLLMVQENWRAKRFIWAAFTLGVSVLVLLVFLALLFRRQSSYKFSSTAHLVAFLPEECVAELSVLRQRMKKANVSLYQIQLRLLEEFVTLLWVFYIQVQLENLTLPRSDREIDD